MAGEFGNCFTICRIHIKNIYCWNNHSEFAKIYYIFLDWLLTDSKQRFVHCLLPGILHVNSEFCSYMSAGFPFGGSGEPLVNWPLRNTPQVQGVWFFVGSVSFCIEIRALSSTFFCAGGEAMLLVTVRNNEPATINNKNEKFIEQDIMQVTYLPQN